MIYSKDNDRVGNIHPIKLDRYSLLDNLVDVYDGTFPYKEGSMFPTDKIKKRADLYNANVYLYNNLYDDVTNSFIAYMPFLDLFNRTQLNEMVTNLPDFKNSTDSWVNLTVGKPPEVELGDGDKQSQVDSLLRIAEFGKAAKHIVRSNIMGGNAVVRIDSDSKGHIKIMPIPLYCWEPRVSVNDSSEIAVNIVFNQYTMDGAEYIQFITYSNNGVIETHTFEYNGNVLGKEIEKFSNRGRAFKDYDISPIVVFSHNVIDGNIIGVDDYRYWEASILATVRTLYNIMCVADKSREYVKVIPKNALDFDDESGTTIDMQKGAVCYEGDPPVIEWKTPSLENIDNLIKVYEHNIQRVSIDTKLGLAFYDSMKLGSNLSAKAIEASMYPARIEANSLFTEIESSLKELVIKACLAGGIELDENDFSVSFSDSFPSDKSDIVTSVMRRYDSEKPTITLEDAIMQMDRVPMHVAKVRADDIKGIDDDKDKTADIKEAVNNRLSESVNAVSGDVNNVSDNANIELSGIDGNPVIDSLVGGA